MRVLIVGLGNQGRKRRAVAGPDVVATVDPVRDDATHRNLDDVPPDAFDAALVCTPDQSKLQVLRYLLDHGKHVLVEKPMLAPEPKLRELIGLARSRRIACYTAYNHRFEPNIVRLKQTIAAGGLGTIYQARLSYGNGTALDVRNSAWRDQGLGVLSDLGSHLLDLVRFLFEPHEDRFVPWSVHRFENRAYDYVIFGTTGPPSLQLEMTLLSWRNTFTIDVLAEHGSAHVDGLCKWGPSSFTLRRRVRPSGKPPEERYTLECPDPTWEAEYASFRRLCLAPETNLENDLWIQGIFEHLSRGTGPGARS